MVIVSLAILRRYNNYPYTSNLFFIFFHQILYTVIGGLLGPVTGMLFLGTMCPRVGKHVSKYLGPNNAYIFRKPNNASCHVHY